MQKFNIKGNSLRIVFLGIVIFLLFPVLTTATTEQEVTDNYHSAPNNPVHQLASSPKIKIENSSQHPTELSSENKKKGIAESFTISPVKKTSKQNYDSAQSITSSKLTEHNEEEISSSYLYVNSTFCTACRHENSLQHGFVFEYNGSVVSQTFEITPYFRIDDGEPPGAYYIPGNVYLSSYNHANHLIAESWENRVFSYPVSYGWGLGLINAIVYAFHTSTHYGNVINSVFIFVYVLDRTSPNLVDYPEDMHFTSARTQGFELNWTATDLLPNNYYIKQNGVLVDSGAFHSNQTVSYQGLLEQLSPGVNEFTITFRDTTGNRVSRTTKVIVGDVTPPAFEHPNNLVYPIGTTGNRLIWKPIDLSTPGSYTLLSSAETILGIWDNNDEITVDVDGLPIGVYNYTIIIRDFYGNFGTDTVLVTVYDSLPPEIDPVDSVTVEHGVLGNSISWTPTDSNPSHYTLKKDGRIVVQNQQWLSGQKVEVSLNDLPVGTNRYEITFYDLTERSVSDSVTTTVVDTTSPTITQELAQIVERDVVRYNPQFYYLNWQLTDLNPLAYTITVNDTLLRSASWQDGDEVLYFLSETELGTYNYTITARDLYGNTVQQSVKVVVQDTLAPAINMLPDKVYDYGNYNHSFSWIVTDGQPAWYNITLNDILLQEGTWDSSQAIEFSSIRPELGSHQFMLQIWDGIANFASDSFILRILDSDTPNIVSPGSQLFELWTTQSIAWIATDSSGSGSYEISKNGKILQLGTWTNGIPIKLQVPTNVTGTYNYEILVRDIVGTVAVDQVSITVFVLSSNSRLPEIANRILEFDTTGENITWYPMNFNNGNYTITRNGQLLDTNFYWLSKDPISISLDNLNLGDHTYNLTILDFSNTLATDIVIITVRDTTEPEVIASSEVEFSIANSQRFFHWKAIDWHPGNYQFTLGMQLISTGSWISNQEDALRLSNHGIGTYNYTLIVLDHFNNNISKTITVTVSDKLKPSITSVSNNTYELGNEIQPIIWQITDDTPHYFKIYKNNTLLHSGSWETGQTITVNITDLPVGTHNYTLLAYDQSRNVATASVFIKIEDTIAPVLEASDDLHLQAGQTGQTISWKVVDLQAGNYILWKDGKLSQTGAWNSGEALTFSVTATATGTYTYTLQILDNSLNMANSSILLVTTDQVPPTISSSQTEFTFEYGSTGNELVWDVIEVEKWNYTITRKKFQLTLVSEVLVTGETEANQIITQTPDTFKHGTYLYTLSIADSAQNTALSTIPVNIIDTTKPVISEEPSMEAFNYASLYYLKWSANDFLPGGYEILLDGIPVKSDAWKNEVPISYALAQFLPGEYNFTITFYDNSRNSVSKSQIFTVEDKTLPSVNFIGNTMHELNSTGFTLNWEMFEDFPKELIIVQDLYLSSFEVSALNLSEIENHFNTPINSDIESIHDLYQYLLTTEGAVLVHKLNYENALATPQIVFANAMNISYTILVYDQSKNLNYMSVNISIIDTIRPEFTLTPNLAVSETEFTWSATDLAPANYTITVNGSIYETNSWDSAQEAKISLATLEPGFYEISIKIYDESLNHNSYEFSLNKKELATPDTVIPRKTISQTFSMEMKVYHEAGDATNSTITWDRPGESPNLQYELYKNGKLTRASEVWPDELQLDLDINSLPPGIHNFTLRVKGIDGDFYRNVTIIEIQDTTAPSITINHGTDTISSISGNIVTLLNFYDINPDLYYVYLNSSIINSGSWKNREIIVINIIDLQPGSYELLITAYDSYANKVIKRLTITVSSNLLTSTQNPSTLEHYLWWLILVAIAIAITLVAMRKKIKKTIKQNI